MEAAAAPIHDLQAGDDLASVVALLRSQTRHDFRGYKTRTLQRRVERRMGLQQIKSLPQDIEFLRVAPNESEFLFRDLLIGVTAFFRDPEAYGELSIRVMAKLMAGDGYESPVRIWVPGCATGEKRIRWRSSLRRRRPGRTPATHSDLRD